MGKTSISSSFFRLFAVIYIEYYLSVLPSTTLNDLSLKKHFSFISVFYVLWTFSFSFQHLSMMLFWSFEIKLLLASIKNLFLSLFTIFKSSMSGLIELKSILSFCCLNWRWNFDPLDRSAISSVYWL